MKLIDYAHKMGISYKTAWRWYKAGKIQGKQMDTGTILVTEDEPVALLSRKVAIYARVSSAENKSNLDTQADRLVSYCAARGYQVVKVVKEVGSGVNDSCTAPMKRDTISPILSEGQIGGGVLPHKH